MKIEGRYKLQAPPERIWLLLTDPRYLKVVLPGCERIGERAPGRYEALLKIGIAAFKGQYKCRLELADTDYPSSYRLLGESGGSRGRVKGEALVRLAARGADTIVLYRADIGLEGVFTAVGRPMLSGVARMLLNQFFKRLAKTISAMRK